MNKMLKCLCVALHAFVLSSSLAFGQIAAGPTLASRVTVTEDGLITVGPDPTRAEDLMVLIGDRQVIRLLGLTDEQVAAARKLGIESHEEVVDLVESLDAESPIVIDEKIKAWIESNRALMAEALAEIITPGNYTRLKQIAYRIELNAIGWSDALTLGRLGRDVEIHGEQKADLKRSIDDIHSKLEREIAALREKAEGEILNLLVPEQQTRAEELLGPYIHYRSQTISNRGLQRAKERLESQSSKDRDG